jgi:hypothetical protein
MCLHRLWIVRLSRAGAFDHVIGGVHQVHHISCGSTCHNASAQYVPYAASTVGPAVWECDECMQCVLRSSHGADVSPLAGLPMLKRCCRPCTDYQLLHPMHGQASCYR